MKIPQVHPHPDGTPSSSRRWRLLRISTCSPRRRSGKFTQASHRYAASAAIITLAVTTAACADQVVSGEANYPAAKIIGLQQGQLLFNAANGKSHQLWVSDVDMIILEREGIYTDFNQAERFLAGDEPERAILRYRRTLRRAESFWLDLIVARLLIACDRADRIDQATLNFIRVVRGKWSGPPAAARLLPQRIPTTRTPKALRAMDHLAAALADGPPRDQRSLLEMLRFEIIIRTGDGRAVAAAKTVSAVEIPKLQRCERTYTIQLTALQQEMAEGLDDTELASVYSAIRYCPYKLLPDFLLLKGKTLAQKALSRNDLIRAAWPFMRVVAHMPDDPRAAEALYEAALILERMGRRDKAVDLLTECLTRKKVRSQTRERAEALRERLEQPSEPEARATGRP